MNEKKENLPVAGDLSPFERIRRTNAAGAAYWSSRDFAVVLGYSDYRNFEAVIGKARLACFNSGHRIEDHFVDVTEMVTIGSGAQRPIKTVLLSRYACYLIVQNADPSKEIVALGQTYFAVQTRRQELSGRATEEGRRLLLREEMKMHNVRLAGTHLHAQRQGVSACRPKSRLCAASRVRSHPAGTDGPRLYRQAWFN